MTLNRDDPVGRERLPARADVLPAPLGLGGVLRQPREEGRRVEAVAERLVRCDRPVGRQVEVGEHLLGIALGLAVARRGRARPDDEPPAAVIVLADDPGGPLVVVAHRPGRAVVVVLEVPRRPVRELLADLEAIAGRRVGSDDRMGEPEHGERGERQATRVPHGSVSPRHRLSRKVNGGILIPLGMVRKIKSESRGIDLHPGRLPAELPAADHRGARPRVGLPGPFLLGVVCRPAGTTAPRESR